MTDDVLELTCSSTKKRNGQSSYLRPSSVDQSVCLPKPQIECEPAAFEIVEIRTPEALTKKHGWV
jgi:hypothetical protein